MSEEKDRVDGTADETKAETKSSDHHTEDTYEIPNLPYLGTYRGRYTKEELRELDAYAHGFGIELVPCVQTLAHLRNYLKWPQAEPLKDSADILKVGCPQVYDFIRQILTSLKDCFQTRNIIFDERNPFRKVLLHV